MKNPALITALVLTIFSASHSLGQTLSFRTIAFDGETREYALYIPAAYDSTQSLPLMFNFHGGGANIASQILISDMRSMADTAGFFIVYPQALPDPADGGSTNWTHKPPTTFNDVPFVAAMIDTIAAQFMVDQNRVYACGYSNGGEFCFNLACELSDRIAAVGVVARSMYFETFNSCAPNPPVPLLTIHGTADFFSPYNGLTFGGFTIYVSVEDQNRFWIDQNGTDTIPVITPIPDTHPADGSTVTHYSWGNGIGCVDVEHMRVDGGGHDWPGSFGNMDINANVEIWKFASRYELDGKIGCTATPACDVAAAPVNLNASISGGSVSLSWDAIPQSVGCQVTGTQVTPAGPSGTSQILGSEPSSISVPISFFDPGSTWDWQVRCACSVSPVDATPYSAVSSFTIPLLRTGLTETDLLIAPNPTTGNTKVQYFAPENSLLEVRVLDLLGQTVHAQSYSVQRGINMLPLEVGSLTDGRYLVEIVNDGVFSATNLIVNH